MPDTDMKSGVYTRYLHSRGRTRRPTAETLPVEYAAVCFCLARHTMLNTRKIIENRFQSIPPLLGCRLIAL
jgi:hypothetical protein